MPWFEVPSRRTQAVTIVFGHWSALGLVLRHNLVALDTGCVWGGQLSAVTLNADWTQRQVTQVNRNK
jgi:bis(5'-nucleosyl)-tetraphosphatase (symmetrical)